MANNEDSVATAKFVTEPEKPIINVYKSRDAYSNIYYNVKFLPLNRPKILPTIKY